MRESVLWGLVTGVAAAAVAWLSDRLGAGAAVSLFPDRLSLITLVVVATIALRRVMGAAPGVTEAKRRGIALGVTVAAVVALATLLRGLIGWSSPDVMLSLVTGLAQPFERDDAGLRMPAVERMLGTTREYVTRFWRVLLQADRVFHKFRARFIGKCSPVHFFWGSFDLAVTRFSGRTAPPHPGGIPNLPDWVGREAYSHEVSSCVFWPGGGPHPYPFFYSYAYPESPGFAAAAIQPEGALYSNDLGEWILPYDVVRTASSPDDALFAFLESTYAAAADLGQWDRTALERSEEPWAEI